MTKEEFEKKMSILLDVLRGASTGNNSQLMIFGSDDTDEGFYFCIRNNKFYTYDMEFGMGDETLLSVGNELGDAIIGMFSDYVIAKTCIIHISTDF